MLIVWLCFSVLISSLKVPAFSNNLHFVSKFQVSNYFPHLKRFASISLDTKNVDLKFRGVQGEKTYDNSLCEDRGSTRATVTDLFERTDSLKNATSN